MVGCYVIGMCLIDIKVEFLKVGYFVVIMVFELNDMCWSEVWKFGIFVRVCVILWMDNKFW